MVSLSEKKDEKSRETEELRKDIRDLQEEAKRDYYGEMISSWKRAVAILIVIPLLVILLLVLISYFFPLPKIPVDFTKQAKVASDIFVATITINGVLTGVVPIISFFFISEIKEHYHEIKEDLEKDRTEDSDEKQKLTRSKDTLLYVVTNNLRSGILKYAKTYITTSILFQVILIATYAVIAEYETMSGLYIFFDISVLNSLVFGIIPIIDIALFRPALRLVQYIIPKKIVTSIESED